MFAVLNQSPISDQVVVWIENLSKICMSMPLNLKGSMSKRNDCRPSSKRERKKEGKMKKDDVRNETLEMREASLSIFIQSVTLYLLARGKYYRLLIYCKVNERKKMERERERER